MCQSCYMHAVQPCSAVPLLCMTLLLISASHHAPLTLSTDAGRGRISLLSLFPTGVNPHTDMQTAHPQSDAHTLAHKHPKMCDDK